MTPSDRAEAFLDELVQAIEARPDEARSFCIPPLNARLTVIHKGLPGGHTEISRGLLDECLQAGLLRKQDPFVLVQYVRYTSTPTEARYSAGVR